MPKRLSIALILAFLVGTYVVGAFNPFSAPAPSTPTAEPQALATRAGEPSTVAPGDPARTPAAALASGPAASGPTSAPAPPSFVATASPISVAATSAPTRARTLPTVGPTPRPVPGSLALAGSYPGIDGFDASIAAGPRVIVLQTNDFIEIREKSGAIVASMSATRFYDPVAVPRTIGTFDGIVQFDPRSRRFFHVAATRTDDRGCTAGTCVSALYFAVSRSDTPRSLGLKDWYKYALDNSRIQDTPTDSWGDMDGIGIDDEVVVLTTNVSAYRDDEFQGKKLRILEKAALLRGEPIRRWRDLVVTAEAGGDDDFYPVVPYGDGNRLLFISPEPARACDLRLWSLQDPLGAPSLIWRTLAYPRPCAGGAKAAQPSGPPLDLPGLWPQPVVRGGTLWGASRISVSSPSGPAAAVRWFQIDVRSWPEGLRFIQDGVVSAEGVSHMYPSIAVAPSGHMALAFLRSSATEFVSAAYAGRLATDPSGSLRPTALLKAGDGIHDCAVRRLGASGGASLNKVSDYTGMTIDPSDGSAWMSVHYVSAAERCVVPTWLGRVDWSTVP